MDEGSRGFLSTGDERPTQDAKGHLASDCPLSGSSEGCAKSPNGRRFAWLDDYREKACRVARYPDNTVIPEPIRAALNVCISKSGLNRTLPNAIAADRRGLVGDFYTAVGGSSRRSEPPSDSWTEPSTAEGQPVPPFSFQHDPSRAAYSTHGGPGRVLQQLDAPPAHVYPPIEADSQAGLLWQRAYLGSMSYYLLPTVVGFFIAGVLLPLFLLSFCLRNRKCCRRLCSCWCCLRAFFKPSKPQVGRLQRWDSNGSSTTASDSRSRRGDRKLVPRRACLGVRYVVLLGVVLVIASGLGLAIYALVDLHAQLSQLGCATGQAASTIINGETFTGPSDPSLPHFGSPSFASPFLTASPFSDDASLSIPETPRPLAVPRILGAGSISGDQLAGHGIPRKLQGEPTHAAHDDAPPKRTGFIGFAPALDYVEDLLVALDPKRPESLPRELRQASGMAARITKTANELKRNFKKLQEVMYDPANRGESVLMEREGIAATREPTYHISPLAASEPSLLGSWETMTYLLPQGLAAIAEASDTLAGDIEASLTQTDNLPPVEQLQATKEILADSMAVAHDILEPLPRLSEPVLWGSILVFSLLGALLFLASFYLCCMCCCKKEALVDKRGLSCCFSFLLMLIAASALIVSGAMLIATTAVTDGCLYTRGYVKEAGDINDLFHYFRNSPGATAASIGGPQEPTYAAAAKVLEACLLPDKERDLVQVFGFGDLVEKGEKMRDLGTLAMRGEASASLLISMQLQDAARELQVVEDTYWLFMLDPLALENEDLQERLFTYREVLCSGLQDKQRTVKASYLALSGASASARPAGPSTSREDPVLLQTDNWKPMDELAALLQELTPNPGAAARLSASVQQTLQEVQNSSSLGGNTAQRLIGGVVGEVMQLAAGKTDAQKAQLLQSVVRLAARANSELQANSSGSGSRAEEMKRRQQRAKLRALLQETCVQQEARDASAPEASDRLLVFGMEDVEELIAPFSLSSLHHNGASTGGDSRLTIDSSFDAEAPFVLEIAAEKGSPEDQRRFLNAVWWAAKKEQLRAEASTTFVCQAEGPRGSFCNIGDMQEGMHELIRKLRAQLDDLWVELGRFFESRSRVFRLMGEGFGDAVSNLDCTIVYNEAQPIGELVCDRIRYTGGNMALVLLVLGCAALLLLPCFCCLWKAGVENKWRRKDAKKRRAATPDGSTNPEWNSCSPTTVNAPFPNNNNAAAAAAVAAAAAATAAAASGLAQHPPPQYQQQSHMHFMRDGDWR